MQNNPLDKVVFIQKVAAFTKTNSLTDLFRLAYVNNSWHDTIKNYSFHIFEDRVCNIEHDYTLENICNIVIQCDVIWFMNALLFSETVLDRINLLTLAVSKSNVDIMQLVFEKIIEIGGEEVLNSQLCATDDDGHTCLMLSFEYFSSPEVMKLFFEKIVEAGGIDLLQRQLSATDHCGMNCLMIGVRYSSSSPEVIKLFFEKIVEAGGKELLKNLLVATNHSDWTCLMIGCRYSSSPEVMKLIFDKIVEAGGRELLRHQLAAPDKYSWNCLMICCCSCLSVEVMKLVVEQMVEAGGIELLRSLIMCTDGIGRNCLCLACSNFSSPEIAEIVAVVLFELGIFQAQYAKLNECDKKKLQMEAYIDSSSWAPDRSSNVIAEVSKILNTVRE